VALTPPLPFPESNAVAMREGGKDESNNRMAVYSGLQSGISLPPCLLQPITLTFPPGYVILRAFPERDITRELNRLWHMAKGLALVIPKGGPMKPMKKPIRLLGMVFQIDN